MPSEAHPRRHPDRTALALTAVALWAGAAIVVVLVLLVTGRLEDGYLGAEWYKLGLLFAFCALLAICVALQMSYRSRRFRGWIVETEDGFELRRQGRSTEEVRWDEVESVTAWEVAGWYRVLYVSFGLSGGGEPVEVHDRDDHFAWLSEELPKHFAQIDRDWIGRVHLSGGEPILLHAPEGGDEDDELPSERRQHLYGT